MSITQKLAGGLVVAVALLGGWGPSFAGAPSAGSVPVEAVMDYLHSVLEANRTFYTVHVVERMQRRGVIESSEKWRELSALPLPAQFFQEASSLSGSA